jgi:energy-coupling factor transporter ATP-binding protein EcfA2
VKANWQNPFSTKFVQPGAITYQRADGGTLEQLVESFDQACHGWASIVGPHGTGKSTLVASLRSVFEKSRPVFAYRLTEQDRSLVSVTDDRSQWSRSSVVVIDGYEQLSWWRAWRVSCWVRRAQCGFLITAHRPMRGFAVLWRTAIDEELAIALRDELLIGREDLLAACDLLSAWNAARAEYPTNMRETLFAMYDWVEQQKQKRPAST